MNQNECTCTAFAGTEWIATGALAHVAEVTKRTLDSGNAAPVLIFDDETSRLVEVDFRGTWTDVLGRLAVSSEAPRGPGRPKLGVVAREVTLLPRHWEWLATQPGGASVALRKLVEEARRANSEKDRLRLAHEAAYRFMSAMAGNEPGFEESCRALFAGDSDRFRVLTGAWPPAVRDHALRLAARAFTDGSDLRK
jgi:hypothetical protein